MMSPIAMMVSRDSLDAPLARTFGKAKWLLLSDGPGRAVFQRNAELSGGAVAGKIAAAGCRDVLAAHLGEKACAHLSALGIRIWRAPADRVARDVIAMHHRGELAPWSASGDKESGDCTSSARGHGKHAGHGHGPQPEVVQLGRRGPRGTPGRG